VTEAHAREAVRGWAESVRTAQRVLAASSADQRRAALRAAADLVRGRADTVLAANAADRAAASGLSSALADRLALTPARLEAIAAGLETVAALPDPLGRVLKRWERPNGLCFERVAVPIGVIAIIYESRPNVTAEAAALCLMSGNGCILRGGSEAARSNAALIACIEAGLAAAGLPTAALLVPSQDRAIVGSLLGAAGLIDLVIPRGGKSLVARVEAEARVPVLSHLNGINHVYVHKAADADIAERVMLDAKLRRTAVCGAAETLLIDAARPDLARRLVAALIERGCEVRGDAAVAALDARVRPASEADWGAEYLDAIIAARIVGGIDEAVAHVARHGSGHTDAIVTGDAAAAERFLGSVDSAIVLWNASTQFADGGEFGFGAEVGIATGRLHARGPVGLEELTTYKTLVRGTGQVRG